uniref:Uncharacterized protein n=1 Tax=Arundo donax TaxID=35708 RepID=A0A0A9H237_ARUDO
MLTHRSLVTSVAQQVTHTSRTATFHWGRRIFRGGFPLSALLCFEVPSMLSSFEHFFSLPFLWAPSG